MITFLPHLSYTRSAQCLDTKTLGKQRLEAKQIIDILEGKHSRWRNHPAVKMWRHNLPALKLYSNAIIAEWTKRGYNNTLYVYLPHEMVEAMNPPWLGLSRLHNSHRSNLLRKNPEHYEQFGWNIPNNYPYYWPA